MANRRQSEQTDWDDRKVNALKACLAGGMLKRTIAQRFGVSEQALNVKLTELGLHTPTPRGARQQ